MSNFEFVWTVDEFCDRISKRDAKTFHRQEAEKARQWGGQIKPTVFLHSEVDALQYLVNRAGDGVRTAQHNLKKANKRLAKCRQRAGLREGE